MYHPYADLIGLTIDDIKNGHSKCSLKTEEKLFNPHRVLHGAVIYSLADTGMGAAVYPGLNEGETCATIEIKINYYKPVTSGVLTCVSDVVNRGKSVVNLESSIYCDDKLVAKANGSFLVYPSNKNKN